VEGEFSEDELRVEGVLGSYLEEGYLPGDVEKRPQKSTE
jgi:hypothetical protein